MFDFSDVTRFAARLNASDDFVEASWKDEWAGKVADEWRNGVPVRTGQYRDSIRVEGGEVVAGAPHAPFVEYGTSDMKAQPALVPAINRLIRRSAKDLGIRVIRRLT